MDSDGGVYTEVVPQAAILQTTMAPQARVGSSGEEHILGFIYREG